MPRFYGQFYAIQIPRKWTKTLEEEFQVLMRQAARAFIKAVVEKVPVWTGMAKGSIAFARGKNGFLKEYLNLSIPISRKSDRPRWYYHPGRKTRIRKWPTSGGKFAQYNFTSSRKQYFFTFRSDVVHYIINDFYGSRVTGPWHSMDAGYDAFRQYIADNAEKTVKKLVDMMVRHKIDFGK